MGWQFNPVPTECARGHWRDRERECVCVCVCLTATKLSDVTEWDIADFKARIASLKHAAWTVDVDDNLKHNEQLLVSCMHEHYCRVENLRNLWLETAYVKARL